MRIDAGKLARGGFVWERDKRTMGEAAKLVRPIDQLGPGTRDSREDGEKEKAAHHSQRKEGEERTRGRTRSEERRRGRGGSRGGRCIHEKDKGERDQCTRYVLPTVNR